MKNKKGWLFWGVIVLVLVGLVGWAIYNNNAPSKLDGLAQCLKDKGAVFYGAFWCPNCQNQKKLFGNAARLLPYLECSTPDGRGQLPVCMEQKIQGYPTWRFTDGSELTGEIPLSQLAEKTSCPLPK